MTRLHIPTLLTLACAASPLAPVRAGLSTHGDVTLGYAIRF